MNKRIGTKVKLAWNVAMFVLCKLFRFVINTTSYHLAGYSLHLLLLKCSMSTSHSLLLNVHSSPLPLSKNVHSLSPSLSLSLSLSHSRWHTNADLRVEADVQRGMDK